MVVNKSWPTGLLVCVFEEEVPHQVGNRVAVLHTLVDFDSVRPLV
jgi:hypothetical protein